MGRHTLRILTAVAMFLVFLAALPAAAAVRNLNAELGAANQSLAAKQYTRAYQQYSRVAANNALAQFNLGLIEREGWGRPRNPLAACTWFGKAAVGNIPAAQQFWGDCLAQGVGQPADGKAAERWYRKAAQSGISYALCSAGALYISGQVLDKNISHGLALCTQAAQAGSSAAMLRLADYFREGRELPQDLTAARDWYLQAAQMHDPVAQYRLGIMLSQGEGGDADPKLALKWLEQAAMDGYAPAYLPVAILYSNDDPDPKTGALTPDSLAKIYMWNRMAKATTTDPAALAQITRIEQLVDAVMPEQWRPILDRRVAEHQARFATE